VTVGSHSVFRGDVAGGGIDRSKRYHIGSIRFGGGGLIALVAAGLIAVSGGGVVAYTVLQEPAEPGQGGSQEPAAQAQPGPSPRARVLVWSRRQAWPSSGRV
jgi:hypothetical protein